MALLLEKDIENVTKPLRGSVPDSRRVSRRLLVLLPVAVLLIWGGWRFLGSLKYAHTDNAQVEGHVVRIQPKVSGFVDRILVEDNQPVRKGDTLLVLDRKGFAIHLQKAEAGLAAARFMAGEGAGQAGVAIAQTQGDAALQGIQAAKAEYDRAMKDARRIRNLAEKGIVPRTQLEAAEALLSGSAANLKAARDQAKGAEFGVAGAEAQKNAADARVSGARAELDEAQLQLSYCALLSPCTGVIAKKSVEAGQFVGAGQALMSVVESDSYWVVANFKETQISGIASGEKVRIKVDAYPGREFGGEVVSIQPATGSRFSLMPQDNASSNFTRVVQRIPVKIAFSGTASDQGRLRPGMSADVRVLLGGTR